MVRQNRARRIPAMATGTSTLSTITSTRSAKNADKTKPRKESCKESCIVCEKVIKDSDETNKVKGQDSLLCEGSCQRWMHRTCAGISKQAAENSDEPFLCHRCNSSRQAKEIFTLKAIVAKLESELALLKAKESPSVPQLEEAHVRPSYAIHVTHTASGTTTQSQLDLEVINLTKTKSNPDRKFNIVVYGIKESPDGTSRRNRMSHDNQEVLDILETVDSAITVQSIRDCFRMGKYSEGKKRPRPILVKMSRSSEVQSILTNRRNLAEKQSISIKADMSFKERAVEKILLKKRWELMGEGVEKGKMKIRGKTLFVNNQKHGFVNESTYMLYNENHDNHDNPDTADLNHTGTGSSD